MLDTVMLVEPSPNEADRVIGFLQQHDLVTEGVLAPNTRYWFAVNPHGDVVGVIGLELGDGAALLRSAVVAPDYRKHGVGSTLVIQAFSACRASGIYRVYCFSTGAGAYWQRFGFVEVPVSEVVAALPAAPQVVDFERRGWLPKETAWRKDLE
jgi:N-acetylglutamate synthase-like GNAT family acetyltransferase